MMSGAAHREQMVARVVGWGQALASAVKGPFSPWVLILSSAEISEAASEAD